MGACSKQKCSDCPTMVKKCQMINGRCGGCDSKQRMAEKQSKIKVSPQILEEVQIPHSN